MGSNLELGIGHAAILQVLSLSHSFHLETSLRMWQVPCIMWLTWSNLVSELAQGRIQPHT